MVVDGLIDFVVRNQTSLLFYLVVIFIIYLFRHKIEWQGTAIGLYKTQVGVPLMRSLSKKHREFFRWLGYVGVGVGFSGMAFIVFMLIKGLWDLIVNPSAPAVVAPVIPGFTIPGVGIAVPLITGWVALFAVIVVHEFSHGVVSKAHDIPVKSSGLLVFGPILGAFVEPDEKKLQKAPDVVQYSMFAAGPFSNILSGIFFTFVLLVIMPLVLSATTVSGGMAVDAVNPGYAASIAGITQGTVITNANGFPIENTADFFYALQTIREGDSLVLVDDQQNSYDLVVNSSGNSKTDKGYIGVTPQNKLLPRFAGTVGVVAMSITLWFEELFYWLFVLNFGIGFANLLPLGPVDGGRMLQTLCRKLYGEKRGDARWKTISKLTLWAILILLLIPIIKGFM